MAHVIALVGDLLFGSNLQGALAAAGHDVELCADEDRARALAPNADVLVVDLVSDGLDGARLIESMKLGDELAECRTLGFYAHIDAEVRARALAAGFDMVVPRSRMARAGADLVTELVAR
ncbi:MAG TPA: hypothetical protein VHE14_04310 [Solirubrobacteraceae bacterium]|nr:hypothetical protein [Solirubrobacteraceae bacterium]